MEQTPDVQAASSPATAQPSAPAESFTIPKRDTPDYAAWRKSGELPKADSAPAKETSAPAADAGDNNAPALEAGKTPQERRPRSNAESRLNELLADLKEADTGVAYSNGIT